MVRLNEWLPNPPGKDSENEWIELTNTGQESVSLAGWRVANGTGKSSALQGTVPPQGYLVIRKPALGITLRNTAEKLVLYNDRAEIVSDSGYRGSAPEGRSLNWSPQGWYFATSSPGAGNTEPAVVRDDYPAGLLQRPVPNAHPVATALLTGILCAAVAYWILRRDHDLSHLFFGRD